MPGEDVHHILFYDYVEDIAERRVPYRPAHLEHIHEERASGRLIMAGALGDPPFGGAFVFRGCDEDQIEAFALTDPYVQHSLVTDRRIVRWNVV